MRLKFTRRDRGNFSGGLLLVLPVCCRDRTERVLAVRATGVMVNGSGLREDSTGFVVGGGCKRMASLLIGNSERGAKFFASYEYGAQSKLARS